jgi:LacI family transcriptional regulator
VTNRTKSDNIDPKAAPPLRRRATMTEVAALAGVSLKTVSRVVNQEHSVTTELIDKVTAAVKELHYRHDVTASSLRRIGRKTLSIGLVLEDVGNPFSSLVHRAIEDVAHSHNVVVFAGSSDEDIERERNLVEVFAGRHVDGLIVVATGNDHSYLEGQGDTPIVFVDRPSQGFDADSVVSDNQAGSHRGVTHLLVSGHKRIGFLGDLHSISTAESRYRGYVEALSDANINFDPQLVKRDLRTAHDAEAAVHELLGIGFSSDQNFNRDGDGHAKNIHATGQSIGHPPGTEPLTAIFSAQNLLTVAALRVLHARGLQHRVALLGFDEVVLADLLQPGVSVLAQHPLELGRLAAELLFARLNGDRSPTRHIVVPTTLIPRGSGEIPESICVR